jgi:anaerobic selenocysteine-containing dehydrogenase
MGLTRRQFLKMAGVSGAGAVVFAGCNIPDEELWVQSPADLPEDLVTGVDNWYATVCRQCASAEGLLVRVMEGRAKKIQGNPDYPTNVGKHSARCEALLQELYHPDRIAQPMARDGDGFLPVGPGADPYSDSLDWLVSTLDSLKGRSSRVALITPPLRGHLGQVVSRFASDYGLRYLTLETLGEGVLRQAVKDVFNADRLPHFDIANAAFVLNFGSDFLSTWVSPVSMARAYGKFRNVEGHERGTFVHVGPRFSMTAANADRWLPVRPGTEGVLALGLAKIIIEHGWADPQAVQAVTGGRGGAALDAFGIDRVVRDTGMGDYFGVDDQGVSKAIPKIERLAEDFAKHGPALAIGGGEAAAQTNGLQNMRAILTLNYLVGSVGQKGGILLNPDSAVPSVPASAGGTSFSQWRAFTDALRSGDIDLVIVRGADPVHSLANLDFGGALERATSVVTFGNFWNETALRSTIVLPEHTSLEEWGDDVPEPGPGHQALGFQQPVVRPVLNTRSFGDVLLQSAERLGMPQGPSGLTMQALVRSGAEELFSQNRGLIIGAENAEEYLKAALSRGVWSDPNTKGPQAGSAPEFDREIPGPQQDGNGRFFLVPYLSNALGGGEGAHLPWLQAAPDPITTVVWESWVELNEKTADELELRIGDVVKVEGPSGAIELPVYFHPALPPDVVAIPVGQGHKENGRYARDRGANVMSILGWSTETTTGSSAWAASRVNLVKTGEHVTMSRNEGTTGIIREPHAGEIIGVTTHA